MTNAGKLPFGLIVILELERVIYKLVWNRDLELYNEEKQIQAKINNYKVLEDAGMIDHVFCDKTGTLTKNELTFHKLNLNDGAKHDDMVRCILLCNEAILVNGNL